MKTITIKDVFMAAPLVSLVGVFVWMVIPVWREALWFISILALFMWVAFAVRHFSERSDK